jgi:hypothetical protein
MSRSLKDVQLDLLKMAKEIGELLGETTVKETRPYHRNATAVRKITRHKVNTYFLKGKKKASPELREKALSALGDLEKTMNLHQIGVRVGYANPAAVNRIKSTGRMTERSAKALIDLHETVTAEK